jgi:peptidoglycan/LPS O-acetylase OafA/YrhL
MRPDIQALRGIAVLLVVLYHAGVPGLRAGYLGVDVFFVISGFLITGMIMRGIAAGRFSAFDFYYRRARRLLPASFVLIACTTVASSWLLSDTEFSAYIRQVIGSLLFSGNIALWRQAGYFDGGADLKPLLHMWSLGIEEQFYFLIPFMLLKVRQRFWGALLVGTTLLSFALCLVLVIHKPVAAFYLLPARAWELGMGALTAYFGGRSKRVPPAFVAALGLAAVLALSFFPIDFVHPRLDALLVCLATSSVILAQPAFLNRGPITRALGAAGDISYSLYLVHWPLFALANNVYAAGEVPAFVSGLLLVASFVLAWLLYRFVETPFRIHGSELQQPALSARHVLGFGAACLIIAVPLSLRGTRPSTKDWVLANRANTGFGVACQCEGNFVDNPKCRSSTAPRVLVWGDSYAMHLVPGLLADLHQVGVEQATRSQCGPVRGLAQVDRSMSESTARRCIEFNESVFAWLKTQPSVTHVILASPFDQYVDPHGELVTSDGRRQAAQASTAAPAFIASIESLQKLGKKVIIVAPPPRVGFDVGLCHERHALGLPTAVSADCSIDYSEYTAQKSDVIHLLELVEKGSGASTIWPSRYLCNDGKCRTAIAGVPLYRDRGHLSYDGSVAFAASVGLGQQVLSL